MPYTKQQWIDWAVEHPHQYRKAAEDGDLVTWMPEPGKITQEGTTITATRLNHIEKGIWDAHESADKMLPSANVVNNLTTGTGGYALDARQGKILNDKIPKTIQDLSALQPTLIWSGNWSSGTITIPIATTLKYSLFIFMSEEGYPFIGTRNPNTSVTNIIMQGADVYPNGTLIELHYAYMTYGGDTWHMSGSMKVIIYAGGGIETREDTAIARIYALI